MSYPDLKPASSASAIVLPSAGTEADVSASCPIGVYSASNDFLSGAAAQVGYTYKKLGGDILDIEFTVGAHMTEVTELDKWLTERYALFQDSGDSINEFEIHHLEWPINEINFKKLEIDYPRFKKIIHKNPDKIRYSKGVKVITWGKCKKDKKRLQQ